MSGAAFLLPPLVVYILIVTALTLIGLALGRDPDNSEDERYAELAESSTPAKEFAA
jgi:SNF family Na+-dependent transporter